MGELVLDTNSLGEIDNFDETKKLIKDLKVGKFQIKLIIREFDK